MIERARAFKAKFGNFAVTEKTKTSNDVNDVSLETRAAPARSTETQQGDGDGYGGPRTYRVRPCGRPRRPRRDLALLRAARGRAPALDVWQRHSIAASTGAPAAAVGPNEVNELAASTLLTLSGLETVLGKVSFGSLLTATSIYEYKVRHQTLIRG